MKAQYFVLRHQVAILLENFEEAFTGVVRFANQNCMCEFAPESRFYDDLPDPVLKILNS